MIIWFLSPRRLHYLCEKHTKRQQENAYRDHVAVAASDSDPYGKYVLSPLTSREKGRSSKSTSERLTTDTEDGAAHSEKVSSCNPRQGPSIFRASRVTQDFLSKKNCLFWLTLFSVCLCVLSRPVTWASSAVSWIWNDIAHSQRNY